MLIFDGVTATQEKTTSQIAQHWTIVSEPRVERPLEWTPDCVFTQPRPKADGEPSLGGGVKGLASLIAAWTGTLTRYFFVSNLCPALASCPFNGPATSASTPGNSICMRTSASKTSTAP